MFLLLEGTFNVRQLTGWAKDLRVSADGDGVAAMAGVIGLRMLADRSGLTGGLSKVMAKPGFHPVHDRGRVLVDLACSIAAGGADISDIEALRAQAQLFGPVASDTTALRALGELGERDLHRIDVVRAAARARLWNLLPAGVPASRFAGGHSCGETIVLRIDSTISIAHSGKENAAPTWKKSFGFHSVGCWIDNTRELAVLLPRAGNAGANTAADLIGVLREAIEQIPADRRDDLLITSDGAGASHALIGWLASLDTKTGRRVQYSVGFDVDAHVRAAALAMGADWWQPCLSNTTGDTVDGLECVEITDRLRERLSDLDWPDGMRLIVRRRPLFDFEQPTLFDTCGWRYSAFVTNTPQFGPDALSVQLLDARHRVHARVEDDVRTTQDTGLDRLPSKSWQVNKSWCAAVSIAVDLIAWMRLYALAGTGLAKAEPKTLRYRIFHVPARLVHARRYRWVRLPRTWPWSVDLANAIDRIRRMPLPAT
jgi:Transposase DDE domain group 1